MTYLIVGLDRSTLTPRQRHVRERDVTRATRAAVAHAGADGIDLVVGAGIGPSQETRRDPRGAAQRPRRPTEPVGDAGLARQPTPQATSAHRAGRSSAA